MHLTKIALRQHARRLWTSARGWLRDPRRLRALIAELDPARARLTEFGQITDRQFTDLARGLGGLNEQFDSMKRALGVLDEVLNDRDQTHALGAARRLCKSAIELVHASLGVDHTVREHMAQVHEGLQRACAMREGFDRSFLLLRTVAMSFRVEAARVDPAFQGVFANVAAAIADIDRRIAASTEAAFGRIEGLLAESIEEHARLDVGEARGSAGAQAAVDAVRHDLDALHAALAPCVEATARTSADLQRSGPLVLEVLRALQYQDIVRQRLEHVGDGLADMAAASGPSAGGGVRERAFLGHAARIQHGQLLSARSEIARAGDAVAGGIGALLGLGAELLERLKDLESSTAQALGSERVAAMFAREIAHLATIAEKSEQANRRVAALVERIESVITVFTGEIEKQVREVKLVALNAQVAAARLSHAGALERLAAETTRISRENADVSHALVAGLHRTLDYLCQLRRQADEFLTAVSHEKAAIERGAGEIGQALRSHGAEVHRLSLALRRQHDEVQARLGATLAEVDFPALIGGCFDGVEGLCRQIETEAGDDLLQAPTQDERLEAHASRYTMEEERDTHRATASGRPDGASGSTASSAEGPASVSLPAAGASAAGDIELF